MKSTTLPLLSILLLALPLSLHAQVGVAAGNPEGESSEKLDSGISGEDIHKIKPPSNLTTKRLDKMKVLLKWDADPTTQGIGNDFVVFRAKNKAAWETLSVSVENVGGGKYQAKDESAPVARYRYAVAAQCGSLPYPTAQISYASEEVENNYVPAKLKPSVGPGTPRPAAPQNRSYSGTIGKFIPDTVTASGNSPPPDPASVSGILVQRNA